MGYVKFIDDRSIAVRPSSRTDRAALRQLSADENPLTGVWTLNYSSERDLASLLHALRDAGFAFAGAQSGWPPAAIVQELKEKGVLDGPFLEIMWKGPDDVIISPI